VNGCISITPPWPLLLQGVPEQAFEPLIDGLVKRGAPLTGVNGQAGEAASFAAMCRARLGKQIVVHDVTRLFRLGELQPSTRKPPGFARPMAEGDVPLVVDWYLAFGKEVDHPMPRVEESVRDRMTRGAIWLWLVEGDVPVCVVGRNPAAANVSRIGPVYTPPEHRRRGYAEILAHAVSEDVLSRGLGAVLFTDQANPTSNALYQRLGYRAVVDRIELMFEAGMERTKGE